MLQGHILLKASQSHAKGGNIDLEAGSSQHMGAGDINLKSGTGSSDEMGGNINIVASTTTRKQRNYSYNYYDLDTSISQAKEINFGFDEVFEDSTTLRQISPQLKKLTNLTRLVSTVPFHVTTVQYLSDERIKKETTSVNTRDLLDRMKQIQLREYGYTNE